MKNRLILCTILSPMLLFSQSNKLFDDYTLGFSIGFGNSIFSNKIINNSLIDKGYFPIYENAYINTINIISYGVEVGNKNTSLYCKATIQKNKNLLNVNMNEKSNINYISFSLDVYNDFCKNEKWKLSPMLGVSVNDFYLSAVSAKNISYLTQTNLIEGFSKQDVFCIKSGIDIKYKFAIWHYFVGIGLNCYYQFEMGDGKWNDFRGNKYESISSSKMSGFVPIINTTLYFP